MLQKNKKLQRKSMSLMAVMNDKHFDVRDINMEDEEDEVDASTEQNDYEKSLNETIDGKAEK